MKGQWTIIALIILKNIFMFQGANTNSLAWSTPDSTKILAASNTNSENEGSPTRLTRSGTTLSPIRHPSKSQYSVGLVGKSLADSEYCKIYISSCSKTRVQFLLQKINVC
jgi:hypothetical protein